MPHMHGSTCRPAVARPRFPAICTLETVQQALVESAWPEEAPADLRGRISEIDRRVLLFSIEHFRAPGLVRFEFAFGGRELMNEFIDTAPRAIDDGAPAKTWAAAFAAVLLAVQWAGIPVVDVRGGVDIGRGLDADLFGDDDEDEESEPLDLCPPEAPRWRDLANECAASTADALGALTCDVHDRARVVRSTLAIDENNTRWLVPSYRALRAQGMVRARVPIGAPPPVCLEA